jgi:hypothetical protein
VWATGVYVVLVEVLGGSDEGMRVKPSISEQPWACMWRDAAWHFSLMCAGRWP